MYYIPLRLCGTIKPPSRGFKWPRRRQGAAEVYKIGTMARKSFLEQEAKASHRAVAHQVDLLHRGQRVLEAEQRSQFESITGRIEAIKNEVRSVKKGSQFGMVLHDFSGWEVGDVVVFLETVARKVSLYGTIEDDNG